MVKSKKSTCPAPPVGGPGGPMEIVFSFDTTGSMSSCLTEVRTKLQEIVERLFADIPNLRIAIFAHGDYCDAANYVTKYVDFTNNVKHLCDFVKTVGPTGGGDSDECYELVLREVIENLTWSAGTQRALVMIGDANPHPKNNPQNTLKIDWKEEVNRLKTELGVTIYGVQAHAVAGTAGFWRNISTMTGGKHLTLSNFGTIVDMMMAVCYREHGTEFFDAYEAEVRAREGAGIRHELTHMFDTLRPSPDTDTPSSLVSSKKRKATSDLSCEAKKVKFSSHDGDITRSPGVSHHIRTRKPRGVTKRKLSTAVLKKAIQVKRDVVKYSLGKPFRELVSKSKFNLKSLPWSKWHLAMYDGIPANSPSSDWIPRPNHQPGFRNRNIFYRDTKCKAVYEFAVQPARGSRKYPMYCRTTQGFNHVSWDTYLLSNPRIRKQLDRVLTKGCKLFVRRAQITEYPVPGTSASSLDELKELLHNTYDYAWNMNGRQQRRPVEKKGKLISSLSVTHA